MTIDVALEVLNEERANQGAFRDALNIQAAALLGFSSVLVPVVINSGLQSVSRKGCIAALLLAMVFLVLCLLDWRFEYDAYPKVKAGIERVRSVWRTAAACRTARWCNVHYPIKRHRPEGIDPWQLRGLITVDPLSPAVDLYDTVAQTLSWDNVRVIKPKRTKLGIAVFLLAVAGIFAAVGAWS